MERLTLIGYWRNEQHPELPDPSDFVDHDWDDDERHTVSMYFAYGTIAWTSMGWSPCRLCDKKENGDLEYTDGVYLWPSGLVHYINDHGVRLPSKIVEHAIARMEAIETAQVDKEWWLSART